MNKANFAGIALMAVFAPLLCSCLGGFLEPKDDPTVFYMMRAKPVGTVDVKKRVRINLMPITTPSYMSRNQIVTLGGGGTVELSEFNRWAESVQSGFTRVLIDDIIGASKNIDMFAYPFVSPDALNLKVFVYDCVGPLGGDLSFKGKWQLDSADSNVRVARDFSFKVPCGNTYSSYVESVCKAVGMLSEDIAKAISEQCK